MCPIVRVEAPVGEVEAVYRECQKRKEGDGSQGLEAAGPRLGRLRTPAQPES